MWRLTDSAADHCELTGLVRVLQRVGMLVEVGEEGSNGSDTQPPLPTGAGAGAGGPSHPITHNGPVASRGTRWRAMLAAAVLRSTSAASRRFVIPAQQHGFGMAPPSLDRLLQHRWYPTDDTDACLRRRLSFATGPVPHGLMPRVKACLTHQFTRASKPGGDAGKHTCLRVSEQLVANVVRVSRVEMRGGGVEKEVEAVVLCVRTGPHDVWQLGRDASRQRCLVPAASAPAGSHHHNLRQFCDLVAW